MFGLYKVSEVFLAVSNLAFLQPLLSERTAQSNHPNSNIHLKDKDLSGTRRNVRCYLHPFQLIPLLLSGRYFSCCCTHTKVGFLPSIAAACVTQGCASVGQQDTKWIHRSMSVTYIKVNPFSNTPHPWRESCTNRNVPRFLCPWLFHDILKPCSASYQTQI